MPTKVPTSRREKKIDLSPDALGKLRCTRVCLDSSGVYHGCGQMDHGGETLIGLVGAHGDAFELLELAEEVLDEMPPLVHLLVDRKRLCAARMLGNHDLCAARVELGDNSVAVERLGFSVGIRTSDFLAFAG
jgi:hypothetical protein